MINFIKDENGNPKVGADRPEEDAEKCTTNTDKVDSEVKKPQLSTAAQQLLEKLQKTYNYMDFMVYGNGQDAKELLSQGKKKSLFCFPAMNWRRCRMIQRRQRNILND